MSNHEVEIAQITRGKAHSGEDDGSTTGSIIVKPPITPGEYFNRAIRGRDGHGAFLSHVVTTSEVTLFVAASNVGTPGKQEAAISIIADRIKRLADNPEKVNDLIDENPFRRPLPRPLKK